MIKTSNNEEKVTITLKKDWSPSKLASYPKACGICFRIMITPIPASIPSITFESNLKYYLP
jgi:hypothetical protein